ncbi:MAG: Photosystem biosis protein BtpA [Pseudomonadota bacterium]
MSLFARHATPRLVGVVHLLPLPGSPSRGAMRDVRARASADAAALAAGGVDGIIVENLGDAPFFGETVDASTIAALTVAALDVRAAAPEVVLGINVLRNDGPAAIAIASAVAASFVRVNVLTGAMVTDQGLLQGCARAVADAKARLGPELQVAADVLVKHATPLGAPDLVEVARDALARGGADAVIVSGSGTGRPTDPARAERLVAAGLGPVWVGSGVTLETAAAWRGLADVVIVGTALHEDGRLDRPLCRHRIAGMRAALSA